MVSPKGRERAAVTISTHRDAHNPPVELPSSSASNFFEEAQAGAAEEAELRRKFQKFASKSSAELSEPDVLTFEDFTRLLEHYDTTSLASLVPYFYAIDRNRDGKLDFQEFFLGSVAADPQTVHILNSFTGRERANFTFDYYDVNRSGFLELEEFQKVCRDCALPSLDEHALRRHTFEKARDLGLMEESQRRGRVLDDESSFIPPNQKQFYEFISTERLRGTSRLFRFQKTLIKQRSRPKRAVLAPEPVDGTELPPAEGDTEDATTEEPSDYEDVDGLFFDNEESPRIASQDARTMPAYTDLLPVAPPCELHLDTEKGLDDAFQIAAEVLKGLSHSNFEGLIPPADGSFTLATADDICALCNAAAILMKDEDMVLTHLQPPLKVFGALHGQIWDLLSHFKWHFRPTEDEGHGDLLYMSYLFLGDYADRGSHSLEVLTILLSLKVLHPNRISLLRGHHENRHVNYHLGLREECEKRLGTGAMEVYEQLNRTFEHMSLAANMGGKMLALGPGIVPSSLHRLDQLRKYRKPLYLPHPLQQRPSEKAERLNEQVLLELFTPSDLLQPEGCEREAEQVKAFCAMQKLNAVVASRQIPATGFAFDFGNRLIRVCSCVNYCDLRRGNLAAILYVVQQDESESAVTIRPKVLAAYPDRKDFLSGRPLLATPSRAPVSLRWPRQSRAPTPGRLRDTQADETGHPVTSIRLLEDQATAAVEDETVHFPVLSFAKASPQG